ncbi:MarR family transcriptional regulator [Nocardioides marmoriginsengisoli]|uniref:MarR family transcriptional regulator n=1 Tax=Nocardioides marmoriginsengisoli TaxID=661483 RepID=A0A3N0CBL3_9ACTN|nr:MarR family transcriptional regulator [Nocardioides marmoriginsengisoli]RNL60456.1 MarR family transcriptional regulator [Nocardioides marmoriginsengisoli]
MSAELQDGIDRIIGQWAVERPELDASPMGVVARVHRAADLLDIGLRPPFAAEGLSHGDFDVLASLRRAGAPYRLSATGLSATMVVTSGAVTKRVDRLVAAGLVSRSVAEHDGRGRLIELTPLGLEVTDRLVARHWANEERLLAGLTVAERDQLAGLLRKLLVSLE